MKELLWPLFYTDRKIRWQLINPYRGAVMAYYSILSKKPKLIIDVHSHYAARKGFLEELLKNMDAADVSKVCLISSGPEYGEGEKRAFERAFKDYADRVVGFGTIFPGKVKPNVIDEYYSKGFRGLKAIRPMKRYDDDDFLPYYEKAEELEMPILFHTGVIARGRPEAAEDVSSAHMRPVYLDRIARLFPRLHIVAAHMGDPWYLEAYMTSQKNPNMWLDISGKAILLKAMNIRRYMGIRLTPDKLLFGLDEPPQMYNRLIYTWDTLFYEMGLSLEDRAKIFGKNAAKMLRLSL